MNLFKNILFWSAIFSCGTRAIGAIPDSMKNDIKPDAVYAFHKNMLIETDIKDAKIAIEYWTEFLSKKYGYRVQASIYEDYKKLVSDLRDGKIDVVHIAPDDYLRIRETIKTDLGLVPVMGGKKTRKYLVIVNSDSMVSKINDLRGKKIAIIRDNELAMMYLNTLLLQNGLPEAENFFSSVLIKQKYSQAILSVFFGQSDACLVPNYALNTVTELNPQISKKTKIIAVSPEIVHMISFFRKDFDEELKKRTKEIISGLNQSPDGQQIFTLFKIEGMVPAIDTDIDSIKAMMDEYTKLKKREKMIKPARR